MTTSHIYPGSHSVNCYLNIKDCDKAIEFYKRAFGATERLRLLVPDGSIAHAELEIEGSMLMMAEENPEWGTKGPLTLGGSPISISVYVPNVDEAFQRALDAGATEVRPINNEFYGDRTGQVQDPFGYKWHLATHVEDVAPEEMQERMDKMMAEWQASQGGEG